MADAAYRQLGSGDLQKAFALVSDIDAFCFRRVREDAKIVGLMRDLDGEEVWQSRAPFADLTRFAGFRAFLKDHWKAHRNRSRLRRRAEKVGSLTFEMAASSGRAVELTRFAIELKRRWLRSKLRSFGTLNSQEWCEALAKSIECPAVSTQPVVTALHIGGKPAAIEVGFVRHRHYYAFLGAYDPEFKHLSPTELLMEDTIGWCFAHGVTRYDLLPPDDAYKLKWTNDAMGVSDWIVCRSLAGRWYMKWRYRILLPLATRFVNLATRTHEWISRFRDDSRINRDAPE
jgi:CelD/BcsL family acetyltransferase involved in cellulose biosynthesis